MRPELRPLYAKPVSATRGGPLFSAFAYPTKIAPESIALFIATHTEPGATIFDGFGGSGTTGLATLLCGNPTEELKHEAARLGLRAKWGPRNAVLYELGALGAFVGSILCAPPEPKAFAAAAHEILADCRKQYGWMYEAIAPNGVEGEIRHAVWSDVLICPACRRRVPLWDACVSLGPARISNTFCCPQCSHEASLDAVERALADEQDDLLDGTRKVRQRGMARIYGVTGKEKWSRPVQASDQRLLERLSKEALPDGIPVEPIAWGDLHRGGYHQGMTHLHHYYTRRNLIAFAALWQRTEAYESTLQDALRLWLLGYNASHSTIMTRVVAKAGQADLVVTSAQPGVLYVSGLPVEKNLFRGLERKIKVIARAFDAVRYKPGAVKVVQGSCRSVDLPDASVDYVFTDPPFGGNIPYSEVNFINEAWLGRRTEAADEIIVSESQNKTVGTYARLMSDAFQELHRILKPGGLATVVFHSAEAAVWNALRSAYESCGFGVESVSVLNKTQGSFKQVTAGTVRGDPVILLTKEQPAVAEDLEDLDNVIELLLQEAMASGDPAEHDPQRLYSRLVAHCLSRHRNVPLDAAPFMRWYAGQRTLEEFNVAAE